MLKKILLSLIVLSLSFSIFALDEPKEADKLLTDLTKPLIATSSSKEVTIRLPANPTTGYQWFLSSYNSALIKPTSFKYQAAEGKMVGAPGIDVWKFKLTQDAFAVPQLVTVTLEYRRPFENTAEKTQVITIVINP